MSADLYPLQFEPYFSEVVWGGTSLATKYNKNISSELRIGESWDISGIGRKKSSVVSNGPFKGIPLDALVKTWGKDILGNTVDISSLEEVSFPLLLKFIDARDDLSIQVHPGEKDISVLGGDIRAKYEAWLILHAEPGASIVYGLKSGVDATDLRQALSVGAVESLVSKVAVKPGDIFPIEPGTVHSIGKGIVLLELQTTSDTTFRLYDYGRVGLNGNPRELHIEQALRCVDFSQSYQGPAAVRRYGLPPWRELLYKGSRFRMERWFPREPFSCIPDDGFAILVLLDGQVQLRSRTVVPNIDLVRGDVVLIPPTLEIECVPDTQATLFMGSLAHTNITFHAPNKAELY